MGIDQAGKDKILSYGDNLLRRSDVELLKGPHWLNDQVLFACTPPFAHHEVLWMTYTYQV